MLRIISWNINGLRAIYKKGFLDWLKQENPDILCLQETKARSEQVPVDILNLAGYEKFFYSPIHKNGYSGTAIFSKIKPLKVIYGLGVEAFDQEGRTIIAEFPDFSLYNIYFPNGKQNETRLKFKLDFYEVFQKRVQAELKKNKKIILCGDVNTAHHPIDLARPEANEKISGFLPIERAWLDRFASCGFQDCFRMFDKNPGRYTWWSQRAWSRKRNIGWRIDYFFVSDNFQKQVENCYHLDKVEGSDHCPVVLLLEVPSAKHQNPNKFEITSSK